MKITTITFNTADSKIVVEYMDGSTEEFVSPNAYLEKFPERNSDVLAVWPAHR